MQLFKYATDRSALVITQRWPGCL